MRRFLLTGLSGVGKSSFVNATFGVQLAETNAYESCTKVVETYADTTAWGRICLIDTPGMEAGKAEIDARYLSLVRSHLKQSPCDVLLYISRLDDTRFRPDERRAIDRLVSGLGAAAWARAWLVLTFGAEIPKHRLSEQCRRRAQAIEIYFRSLLRGTGQVFQFQKIIIMDNMAPNWSAKTLPISKILVG